MMSTAKASSLHGHPPRATAIWLGLLAATALTWYIGEGDGAGPAIAALLFVIAYLKGAMILLDYMALRRAPLMWPIVTFGWMSAICALIGLAYWKGLPA